MINLAKIIGVLSVAFFALLSAPLYASAEPELIGSGRVINDPDNRDWAFYGTKTAPVPTTFAGLPGGASATLLEVEEKGKNPYDVGANIPILEAISEGDQISVTLVARGLSKTVEGGGGRLNMRIQQNGAPYDGFGDKLLLLKPTWRRYQVKMQAQKPLAIGKASLALQFAGDAQTIEIGGVFITKEGNALTGAKFAARQASRGAAINSTPYEAALKTLREQLPSSATLINDPAVSRWTVGGATPQTVSADAKTGPVGGKAISVVIPKAGEQAYSITAHSPIDAPIAKGDTIFLAVQLRASSADNEAGSGVISVSKVERSSAPYTSVADAGGQVSSAWTMLYSVGVSPEDFDAGQTHVALHLATARQTIELGNAYVFNLGKNANLANLPVLKIDYPGRAEDAPWRVTANERIEKIRKADIAVRVVDAKGAAISGANVKVEMKQHAFAFGSFVSYDFHHDTEQSKTIRENFSQLFNAATAPLYWSDWGWQSPDMRRNFEDTIRHLAARNIKWRGHPIIYPGENFTPTKLKDLASDKAAYTKETLNHVQEVSAFSAKYKPFAIDVINEPRDGGYTVDRIGIDGVAKAFQIAKSAMPDAHLFVNDYGIISGGGFNEKNVAFYHDFIGKIIKAGAPVSGIGVQGHFGAALTDPARVIQIFDDFGRYNLPIQITEFDIDTTDEATQADYTRDMLTAAFSHPKVEAFIIWGFWEGDHWRPNGAMLRKDWTPKPNYHAWKKRIYSDWWTNETRTTNATGEANLRGFLGDYVVTVTTKGKTVTKLVSIVSGKNTLQIDVR